VELLVVIVIIAALAGFTAPMIIKKAKAADAAEAISNARQIGMAMYDFQSEYNSYPDSNTEGQVDKTGNYTLGTTSSNNYFAQLFASGMCESEMMFYAKVKDSKKPDGNVVGAAAIAAGECGFGYVLNTAEGLTASGNPSRIIVASPILTGNTFDEETFDKKAVLLRIDNSVTTAPIKLGLAMSTTKADTDEDLFGTASGIWGTGDTAISPTIVAPAKDAP